MSVLWNDSEKSLGCWKAARGFCSVGALTLALGAEAVAAPAAKPTTPAPAPLLTESPDFSWDGAYVGVNMGGGFGPGGGLRGFGTDATLQPNDAWSFSGANVGGPLGGAQAGWNRQFGPFVAGVEADMQAAGLTGGASGVSTAGSLVSSRQSIDWFGTLRGRLGVLVSPTFLVYGTGGLAYGGGSARFNYFNANIQAAQGLSAPTRAGFAAGAGLEWAFLPEWSAKLEYLYVDLGRGGAHGVYQTDASSPDNDTLANAATLSGVRNRLHAMRLGLNYHFTPYASQDAVAALTPINPIGAPGDKFHEIETHYIFGFTDGADIDAEGEKELEVYTNIGWSRRRLMIAPDDPDALSKLAQGYPQGSYRSIGQKVEFEHTLTQNFQYAIGVSGLNHRIRGVDGVDDLNNTALYGLSGEFRYVLIGRGPESPIGVTIQTEPEWGHVSGTSGQQEHAFGAETRLVVDTEIIPNRLYAAANLLYEPEISRGAGENNWARESTLGVTGALTYRLTPKIAVGGDLQYLRAHSGGFSFNKLEGQSLFLGPHVFIRLARKLFMSASFAAQLRGHAAGETHALDLANFNRYMARVQFGIEF